MTNQNLCRRTFLSAAALAVASTTGSSKASPLPQTPDLPEAGKFPIKSVSSANGLESTKRAYDMIKAGSDTLEAVVAGVEIVENDPRDTSVGYGGLPNEDGIVELDAAVMHGPRHRAGSVAALRNIKNPAQVAMKVLNYTDHELLVGEGALRFARAFGFTEEDLLTERARKIWLRWKQNLSATDDWLSEIPESVDPETAAFFRENSIPVRIAGRKELRFRRPTGTIHCSAMNAQGDISCTTTTSGLAFKIPGRVGDSPIIGAGLYVDNEIGSCGSTGRGEANLQNLCSFAAVELMRNGMTPAEAGLEICRRIVKNTKRKDLLDDQGKPTFDIKFYLLDKFGRHAGVSMYGPAKFAVTDEKGSRLEPCEFLYKRS